MLDPFHPQGVCAHRQKRKLLRCKLNPDSLTPEKRRHLLRVIGEPTNLQRLVVDSSGRFLKEDGGWTFDESEAISFESIAALMAACSHNRVEDAQILLRFHPGEFLDVKFPLSHEPARLARFSSTPEQ